MSLLMPTSAELCFLLVFVVSGVGHLAPALSAGAMDARLTVAPEVKSAFRMDAGVSTPSAPRDAVSSQPLQPMSAAAPTPPQPSIASCNFSDMHGKVIKLPMRFLTESFLEQAETCLKDPSPCDPEELPGLYFWTAERYKEHGRVLRLDALSLEKVIIAAIQTQMPAQMDRLRNHQRQSEQAAAKFLQTAVDFYLATVQLPQVSRRDEALLGLGVVYVLMDKPDLAVEQYQHVIRDLPKSKFIPDAYLALGEIRFAKGDWISADRFYTRVLKLPPSRAVPCALYKQAWTDYRRGFRALARKSFATCQKIPPGLLGNQDFTDQLTRACTVDAKRLGLLSE